ncbi:MAG: hypothetical protein HY820_00005, partial [Acidobacteria bacterium]|nr:hypothetical protein [Acidobacteriota bacterium]
MVGLLLGWHKPCAGRISVDGELLDADGLARLRQATAWIDPQVHLFNESLFQNLSYVTATTPARGWALPSRTRHCRAC